MPEYGLPISSTLRHLWRRLTEAPAHIMDPERRRQLRLLSGLLLVLIPLTLISISAEQLLFPGFRNTFLTVGLATAMLVGAYGLSRTGYYFAGALLTISVVISGSFAIVLLNPDDAINYAFPFLGMFLAHLLFGAPGVWVTTLLNLFGVVVLLPQLGIPLPDGDPLVAPIFYVVTAALLLVSIRHRDALERDRRAVLERRERDVREIFDHLQDTYYRVNLDGQIERASPSAGQLLGYSPEELVGMPLADFYADPDGRAQFLETLKAHGGAVQNYEAELRRRDGSSVWVSTNAHYLRDAEGRLTGIEGTTRDITERKRVEEHLSESEAYLRAVISNAPVVLFTLDRDGILRFSEGKGLAVLQLKPGEAVGRSAFEMYRDYPQICADIRRALAGEPVVSTAELGPVVFETHYQPVRSPGGDVDTVIGLAIDITERRQAERALAQSESNFRTLIESANVGILVNFKGKHVFANPRVQAMLGYNQDEIHQTGITDLVHPDEREKVMQRFRDRTAGKTVPPVYETIFVTKAGEPVPVEITAATTTWQGEPAGLAFLHDIRERKQAARALQESEALLAKAEEVAQVGSFSWDLKTNEVQWSRQTYRLFGIDPDTPHPDIWQILDERLHPDDKPKLAAAIEKIQQHGTRTPMELRVVFPDGTIRTLWNDGEVLFDGQSRPYRMFGAMQDITDRKHAEERLQALLEAVPDLMFRIRSDGTYLDCKLSALVPTLVDPSVFIGRKAEDILPPDVAAGSMAAIRKALATQAVQTHTYQLNFGGERHDYEARIAPCGPDEVLGMVRDITEARRAEAQMQKLSSAVEQTADSVIITDRDGVIEYANPAFERSTGYSRAEAIGRTPRIVKSGKQTQAYYEHLWRTILAGEVFGDVLINRRKDGTLYYEEETITPLKDANGVITHFISTGKDVTERMQTQERLQYMAQHDALTELPNRLLLLDRLKQSLARARWHERLVAVLFIDLDRFKTINDSLGHEAGDRLLQQLAERFTLSVREGDTVARFGGDEFVILLDDVASDKDVGMVAQKVLDALAAPFLVHEQNLYITASIGVSLFPGDGEDSSTLLKHADTAMYRAKEMGKNTYQFYSSDMSARAFERLSLETRLRHALDRNEFVLHYQPQVDADSGRIVGVEALIRWQHPDFGLVAPSDFIPLLEETGLIVATGEWVLHVACAQLARWQRDGWRDLRMAVNLSPRQFQGKTLRHAVDIALSQLEVSQDVLELEITESLLVKQDASTLETLDAFREIGVRVAIDDFGTGYSSLSYLRRLPIDSLKIDRSFVHDIPHDPDDSAITSAIAALATSLKLEMIAEGVESAAQCDFLRALGCRVMQGNLFSRPLPADDIAGLLTARNSRA